MRKIIFRYGFISIITTLVLVTGSCKKGQDDPAFTLLSRKARLAGNWKFQKGEINIGIKDSSGATGALKYTLSGSTYHLDNIGNGSHFDGTFGLTLSFTKKGVFTVNEAFDSISLQSTGVWDFLEKGKGYKNKERIAIRLDKITGNSDYLNMFNMSLTPFNYEIKELRNKTLVLTANEETIAADEGGVAEYVTAEYTFTQ